jgi:membrane protease YdiL (CAAX protease family)
MLTPTIRPTSRLGPAAAACVAGAALLLARPWLARAVDQPAPMLVAVFVTLGVVGLWWPVASPDVAAPAGTAAWVGVIGVAAFLAGRLVAGGAPATPGLLGYVVLNSLAAVAEEAFFRRLVYDALAGWGPRVAVVGSAATFAAVHVTVWGVWVLPLDLAAGLLLSWQRRASGRWSVPAATHVVANVLAVIR